METVIHPLFKYRILKKCDQVNLLRNTFFIRTNIVSLLTTKVLIYAIFLKNFFVIKTILE